MNGLRVEGEPDCTCDEHGGDYHGCPFQEDVNGNDDPEACDCCPACESDCGQSI